MWVSWTDVGFPPLSGFACGQTSWDAPLFQFVPCHAVACNVTFPYIHSDVPLKTALQGKGGGYPTPDFRAGLDWWLCQGWRGLIARCRSHIQLGQLYAIPPSQASVPHAYTCRLRVRRAEAAHQRGVVSQARELDSLECREP